jgi:hypothetical protein
MEGTIATECAKAPKKRSGLETDRALGYGVAP